MSSIQGKSFTLDTTGEVIADGGFASGIVPNELSLRVTSGTVLIGGDESTALYPLTADDGHFPINLADGDLLWGKGDGGAATIVVLQLKGN